MTESLAKLRVSSRKGLSFPWMTASLYITKLRGSSLGGAAAGIGAEAGGGGGGGGTGVGSVDCEGTDVEIWGGTAPDPSAARSSSRDVAASSL